ncbi:MAG: GNAT family N-acetyltransferase [Alphaproteobacteria bacterium]
MKESPIKMRIRKAIPDDALAIKTIHNKTYQTSYRGYVPNEYLDDLIITDDILQRTQKILSHTECYVVVDQNCLIAFAYILELDENVFEINALYVLPEYQKLGAGSLLVNYVCNFKKDKAYKQCLVWTMKDGPSVKFYNKQGFQPTGNEKVWKFDIPIIELIKML